MKNIHLFILGSLLIHLLAATSGYGQILHFSQYYNNPLLINPANTGFAPDADWRVGASHRNQWADVMTNPYKTFSVWGDAQLFNDRFENGWVGVGGVLLSDKAGTGNLSVTRALASVAYHQVLGINSLISLGFQGGIVQKRIDFSKLTFNNQWNGKFFDLSIPPTEAFGNGTLSYMSLNLGLNYAYFPADNIWINAGLGVTNINRPNESFLVNNGRADLRVPVRFTGFADASLRLSDKVIINPNIYYSQANQSSELVGGLNARYNLSGDGSTQIIGGAYYRLGDAVIPTIGLQWNDFALTVNYDVTTSQLGAYNGRQGAYEMSLVKSGLYSTGKSVKCPTVKF